jgi:uncharacterized membrane protein YhiD involved in acid resistance
LFPAAMTGSEATTDILFMLVGCAFTIFNKQFAQDTLQAQRWRFGREQDAWEEPFGRILAVVVGIGFVGMGGAMLLGYG